MKVFKRGILSIVAVLLVMSSGAYGEKFSRPEKPDVNKNLGSAKEQKIDGFAGMPANLVIAALTEDEFMVDRDYLYKAIYKAFNARKAEAMTYARQFLSSTINSEEAAAAQFRELILAKRILEVFPDEAAEMIIPLYGKGSHAIAGNVIRAAGQVAEREEIDEVLKEALNNTAQYEDESPDMTGYPMRVCDLAYNQLVLRYRLRNIVRTISPGHRIEVRDSHIEILKDLLRNS